MRAFAFAVPVQPAPQRGRESRLYQVRTAQGAEAQVVLIGAPLSPEQVAELRRAVTQAVADGHKLKFRVDRRAGDGGGSAGGAFDINIQTLVRGE